MNDAVVLIIDNVSMPFNTEIVRNTIFKLRVA
jgi:hypothetical protein